MPDGNEDLHLDKLFEEKPAVSSGVDDNTSSALLDSDKDPCLDKLFSESSEIKESTFTTTANPPVSLSPMEQEFLNNLSYFWFYLFINLLFFLFVLLVFLFGRM